MQRPRLNLIAATLAALLGTRVEAADLSATATSERRWSTAAHLGFGVADSSTTGFERVAGSMYFVDLARRVTQSVEVGLRSIGLGGRRDEREYYRLATGPLISWAVNHSWTLQLAAGVFQETGLAQGDEVYRSRGQAALVGWERTFNLGPRLDLAWGGFVGFHRGDVAATTRTAPTSELADPATTSSGLAPVNTGRMHGVEMALRFRL